MDAFKERFYMYNYGFRLKEIGSSDKFWSAWVHKENYHTTERRNNRVNKKDTESAEKETYIEHKGAGRIPELLSRLPAFRNKVIIKHTEHLVQQHLIPSSKIDKSRDEGKRLNPKESDHNDPSDNHQCPLIQRFNLVQQHIELLKRYKSALKGSFDIWRHI